MRNYTLKNGTEITTEEMAQIHDYYEVQCTKEFILDNYDLDEDKAEEMAKQVREKMNDYYLSESEAIEEVLDEFRNKNGGLI